MRKERDALAVEWVRAGERQSLDMGGEELLSCQFFVREGLWVRSGLGTIPTQVRVNEDPEVLDILLDKLLDRFQEFLPQIGDKAAEDAFCEKLHWFGPEMAEEY